MDNLYKPKHKLVYKNAAGDGYHDMRGMSKDEKRIEKLIRAEDKQAQKQYRKERRDGMSKLIYNPKEGLFWNNKEGWVPRSLATRFTEAEVKRIPYKPGRYSVWVDSSVRATKKKGKVQQGRKTK